MDWTFLWETEPTCKSRRREGEKTCTVGDAEVRRDATHSNASRSGQGWRLPEGLYTALLRTTMDPFV